MLLKFDPLSFINPDEITALASAFIPLVNAEILDYPALPAVP